MKNRWNSLPIAYKLFSALFGGITVAIIILLSYLWVHESAWLLKKEQDFLHVQSISVANGLNTHLSGLQKELLFLSRLEVMNDMVTRDMDQRITSILKQKADDLNESIILFAIARDFTVSASSQLTQINTHSAEAHSIQNALKHKKSYFFLGQNLYFFTPIHGTFYSQDHLGYLVMAYPLKSFANQLETTRNLHRWLTSPITLSPIYKNTPTAFNTNDYLQDTIVLNEVLDGWELHSAIPKKEILASLYRFQTLLLSVFGIAIVLIAFLVWGIILRIVKPLRALSDTAKTITLTGDYTQTVTEPGNDEVGMMAHSFNALMSTTRMSMERIELLGKTQAALQAKSAFLSAMSHELRTPLSSILSLTQYLQTQTQIPESVCETVGKIENSAYHLLGVINNVLDLAKAESGKMEPNLDVCNPVVLIEEALELVSPLAEDKELQIKTMLEPFEGTFRSDPRLFRQVVINLLSNAIKYTDSGWIEVTLKHRDDMFTVEITDSGRGIAPEALENLFDEFYQVRSKNENGVEGTGLGLAISKRIAVLLQGDLSITSQGEGKGTTAQFIFRSFLDSL